MFSFNFTLRQKILVSYFVFIISFIALMLPLSSGMVKNIVHNSLRERSKEIIEKIKNEQNDYALIQKLKEQRYLIFFRVGLITDERKLLYDSYTRRLLGPQFNKNLAQHPEVEQAFKEGIGFYEGESKLLKQKFLYTAEAFDFHGKKYILRTAFPYNFVEELIHDVEFGLIGLSLTALLLFSLLTWFIISRMTHPIHQIIETVKPFQEGRIATLPNIQVDANAYDDVKTLATALNLLSSKIQTHINEITQERNETIDVLESLVEGILAIDEQGMVTYANQTALNLLNLNYEQFVEQPFHVIQEKKLSDLLEECQQTRRTLTDTVHIKRGDKKLFLDVITVPRLNNTGVVLIMEDKSAHYKLMNMRKDFIANASHELKTPITIIRGFAETLHDNPNLPTETATSITEKILHNCKRMATLVKDLLVLTDVENIPNSRLIECDLYDLINTCTNMLQDLYPSAKIELHKTPEEEFFIIGDPNLLELAIMNLLENAAKYSQAPAEITIILDKEDDQITLSIADRGIGIPAPDLEHIFQRFYTVDKARSRKLGGSGLGLSIVETIIEKHGGKISVSSEVDKGSTFTMILKAYSVAEPSLLT